MIQKFVSNLSEKERRVFYIAAVFVAIALFDRLFINPILKQVGKLDQQIEEQKINIVRDQRILSYREKIEKESQVFSQYFTENIADDDVVNAAFLSLIEKLATLSKVSLVKSNPSHTNKQDSFNEYFANVDCEGKLDDVVSFMHTLNTTDDLLKVVKFNMSPKRGSENEVKSSMLVSKLIVH